MVPVPPAVSKLLTSAIVPLINTVPVPLPDAMVTPESPTTIVMIPSPTASVAFAPKPDSSASVTENPTPSIARSVCSVALSVAPGAATAGASLTATTDIVAVDVAENS